MWGTNSHRTLASKNETSESSGDPTEYLSSDDSEMAELDKEAHREPAKGRRRASRYRSGRRPHQVKTEKQ